MGDLKQTIKRWLNPVVFGVWSVFLFHLLASQHYRTFLRPEFGLLLIMALLIALGFTVVGVMRPQMTTVDRSAIPRALVLLVPVLYYVVTPETLLGTQAFKTRFVGTSNETLVRQATSEPTAPEPEPVPSADLNIEPNAEPNVAPTMTEEVVEVVEVAESVEPVEEEPAQEAPPEERTIIDLLRYPQDYNGKRVLVTGMIMHDDYLKPFFDGKDTAIYRFLITCCIADAMPLAIVLDSDQTEAFADDQWVQVEGIFDYRQIDGQPIAVLMQPQIKPVEAPRVPYLY